LQQNDWARADEPFPGPFLGVQFLEDVLDSDGIGVEHES
jgi:hypothetical protein